MKTQLSTITNQRDELYTSLSELVQALKEDHHNVGWPLDNGIAVINNNADIDSKPKHGDRVIIKETNAFGNYVGTLPGDEEFHVIDVDGIGLEIFSIDNFELV